MKENSVFMMAIVLNCLLFLFRPMLLARMKTEMIEDTDKNAIGDHVDISLYITSFYTAFTTCLCSLFYLILFRPNKNGDLNFAIPLGLIVLSLILIAVMWRGDPRKEKNQKFLGVVSIRYVPTFVGIIINVAIWAGSYFY